MFRVGVLLSVCSALALGCGSGASEGALPRPEPDPPRFVPPEPSFGCREPEPTDTEEPGEDVLVWWIVLNADDDGNVSDAAAIVRTSDRRCHFVAGTVPEGCDQPAPYGDRVTIRDCAHEDFDERVLLEVRRPAPDRLSVHHLVYPADRDETRPLRERELGAIEIPADARVVASP